MTAGPIDGSSCDTLGINNEVVAKYRNYRSTDRISEIDFYDVSYFNPTEWEWDFGDGQSSRLENPSHRYTASDTYTVCLTARNAFSEDTYCKDITIEETNSTAEFGEGKFMVYPNPTEDILYIETSGDRYNNAEIVDVSGQTVRRIRLISGTNRTEVALDDIPRGLYFLKINHETKKFVKF
jgi:PKD repeat protein